MKQVTILGLKDTSSTIITGPLDIFFYAGRLWNVLFDEPMVPYFDVEIVSVDGEPITCVGNVVIQAHRGIASVGDTDLIIIPSVVNIDETLSREKEVVPWIKKMVDRGAHVAAICTGTAVLAETGLLDGKIATTHWGYAELFRHRYPKVRLKPERLITESGNIFTAGGSNACFDIALYLVRKYCGLDIARKLAKTFLHDLDRISQAPWIAFQYQRSHQDPKILQSQELLEDQYAQTINLDDFSRELGMSRRTFERRFKSATGDTPRHYIQRLRVEAAKRMLETGNPSFDEVAYSVGYEDRSFFRKIFTQIAGINPRTYRDKWRTPIDFALPAS